MQKACWQDESEVFGEDDPYTRQPHLRNVAPWEEHSLTSQEVRTEDALHAAAANIKVKHMWAAPSEVDLQIQFDKQLVAQDYAMKAPWDQVRPGDNADKMAADASSIRERNASYKYDALWSEPQMTASRLEQLACYEMNAPFEREGDVPEVNSVFEARQAQAAQKKKVCNTSPPLACCIFLLHCILLCPFLPYIHSYIRLCSNIC